MEKWWWWSRWRHKFLSDEYVSTGPHLESPPIYKISVTLQIQWKYHYNLKKTVPVTTKLYTCHGCSVHMYVDISLGFNQYKRKISGKKCGSWQMDCHTFNFVDPVAMGNKKLHSANRNSSSGNLKMIKLLITFIYFLSWWPWQLLWGG